MVLVAIIWLLLDALGGWSGENQGDLLLWLQGRPAPPSPNEPIGVVFGRPAGVGPSPKTKAGIPSFGMPALKVVQLQAQKTAPGGTQPQPVMLSPSTT